MFTCSECRMSSGIAIPRARFSRSAANSSSVFTFVRCVFLGPLLGDGALPAGLPRLDIHVADGEALAVLEKATPLRAVGREVGRL